MIKKFDLTLPEHSDRELNNLMEIRDYYTKYVVTMDELALGNVNGISKSRSAIREPLALSFTGIRPLKKGEGKVLTRERDALALSLFSHCSQLTWT